MPERPFRYRVRVHPRARRILIRVTPGDGVVVTVPPRLPRRTLEAALSWQQDWILEQLEQQAGQREALARVPDRLELAASEECHAIHWQKAGGRPALHTDQGLEVIAPDAATAHRLLGRFVRERARDWLPPRLYRLAERHGLRPTGCTIRRQKSRWGSCSSRGHISLNDRLMFLPPALVDHVLLHELAHLEYPHHGPAFHRLLERLDPDARRHAQALRHAGEHIPAWLPNRL